MAFIHEHILSDLKKIFFDFNTSLEREAYFLFLHSSDRNDYLSKVWLNLSDCEELAKNIVLYGNRTDQKQINFTVYLKKTLPASDISYPSQASAHSITETHVIGLHNSVILCVTDTGGIFVLVKSRGKFSKPDLYTKLLEVGATKAVKPHALGILYNSEGIFVNSMRFVTLSRVDSAVNKIGHRGELEKQYYHLDRYRKTSLLYAHQKQLLADDFFQINLPNKDIIFAATYKGVSLDRIQNSCEIYFRRRESELSDFRNKLFHGFFESFYEIISLKKIFPNDFKFNNLLVEIIYGDQQIHLNKLNIIDYNGNASTYGFFRVSPEISNPNFFTFGLPIRTLEVPTGVLAFKSEWNIENSFTIFRSIRRDQLILKEDFRNLKWQLMTEIILMLIQFESFPQKLKLKCFLHSNPIRPANGNELLSAIYEKCPGVHRIGCLFAEIYDTKFLTGENFTFVEFFGMLSEIFINIDLFTSQRHLRIAEQLDNFIKFDSQLSKEPMKSLDTPLKSRGHIPG